MKKWLRQNSFQSTVFDLEHSNKSKCSIVADNMLSQKNSFVVFDINAYVKCRVWNY